MHDGCSSSSRENAQIDHTIQPNPDQLACHRVPPPEISSASWEHLSRDVAYTQRQTNFSIVRKYINKIDCSLPFLGKEAPSNFGCYPLVFIGPGIGDMRHPSP